MSRQRNNISKLPQPVRWRICELLDDGATYTAIRNDDTVASACAERNLTLHNCSFLAFRGSQEFEEYKKAVRQYRDDLKYRSLTAFLVDQERGSDAIAKVANFELLRLALEKLESGELEAKEISAISGAVAAYERNRISESKENAKRAAAEKEAEYQAKIAELSATITQMNERLTGTKTIDSRKVADELDAALGVR
jgi:ribosomal protein L14E/L6E/L27E